MSAAKVTSKGQITLPKEIRDALGLSPGDRVHFVLEADGTARMTTQKRNVTKLFGSIRPKVQGVTLEDMEEAIGAGSTR